MSTKEILSVRLVPEQMSRVYELCSRKGCNPSDLVRSLLDVAWNERDLKVIRVV